MHSTLICNLHIIQTEMGGQLKNFNKIIHYSARTHTHAINSRKPETLNEEALVNKCLGHDVLGSKTIAYTHKSV
jgi:hypothetical protein